MAGSLPLRLYCATSNPGKLGEFREAAGGDIQVEGLPPLACPEEGATFEENAIAKALCHSRAALVNTSLSRQRPLYVFADDSGIEVDALGGDPGVRSARFSGPEATDLSNNKLLLERLRGVPAPGRGARFVCSIALTADGELVKAFHGSVEGGILDAPAGSEGFGYDPLFFYPPLSRSFGELSDEEKWGHSHRGTAFRQMLEWLHAAVR
jgi:XTP/dITP diphosphohydrolase